MGDAGESLQGAVDDGAAGFGSKAPAQPVRVGGIGGVLVGGADKPPGWVHLIGGAPRKGINPFPVVVRIPSVQQILALSGVAQRMKPVGLHKDVAFHAGRGVVLGGTAPQAESVTEGVQVFGPIDNVEGLDRIGGLVGNPGDGMAQGNILIVALFVVLIGYRTVMGVVDGISGGGVWRHGCEFLPAGRSATSIVRRGSSGCAQD